MERNGYHISISMDLTAVGLANIFGSCFGSFVVAGGFSRSALNARAASQMSGFFAVFVSLLVVFAVAPLLSMLPDVVLNVVLFVAVASVIDYKTVLELTRLRDKGRNDLLALCVAFIATAFTGVVAGMMMAIGFSLVVFVFNSAYPPISHLRRESGSMYYEAVAAGGKKITIFGWSFPLPGAIGSFRSSSPDMEENLHPIKILRFEAPLWFANVNRLSDRITDEILLGVEGLVLDMSTVSWIDVTACTTLKKLIARITEGRVHMVFVNANHEVKHMMQITCDLDESRFFKSLYKAELAAEMWGEEDLVHSSSLDRLSMDKILTHPPPPLLTPPPKKPQEQAWA
jgi:SulP family sulfate permease